MFKGRGGKFEESLILNNSSQARSFVQQMHCSIDGLHPVELMGNVVLNGELSRKIPVHKAGHL
jgi:hypothetical protein